MDGYPRNRWTDILGTGGRFPPERMDTFPGIRTQPSGDIFQTVSRRTNLLALGEKYKGKFSVKVMMDVLDTPYEKGGAQRPRNIYETIFVPKNLNLWLKTPGTSDWETVDLARHFDMKVK